MRMYMHVNTFTLINFINILFYLSITISIFIFKAVCARHAQNPDTIKEYAYYKIRIILLYKTSLKSDFHLVENP